MNQIKVAAVLNYVAIVVNVVVGLLYTPYMLRSLGQSEYGIYSLAYSVIAYLTVLDLGFGNAIVRYTAKYRAQGKLSEQEYLLGMFLLLYVVIGIIAFFAGAILAMNVENLFSANMTDSEMGRIRIMLWLMTFNLAFSFPMGIWGSVMSAYERFVFQREVGLIRSILNPLVMVALLAIGYKAVAMVVVTTIFNVVTLLINYWYCRHILQIRIRIGHIDTDLLREVSVYSFWIFLNIIMDRIYWSTGQFVLGIYKGATTIAVYAVAINLQSMYMMFSTAISSLFLPKVTAMVTKENNEKRVSDLFISTGRIQYIVMALVLTGFIIFGKSFILLWAGEGYRDAYIISLLFFIPLTVPLIQNIGIVVLQARNQMKFRSVLYVVIAIASLFLSILLAKQYGGIGCAFATSAAIVLGHIIVMNIYYSKVQHIDIKQFWKEIGHMSVVPVSFILLYIFFADGLDALFVNPLYFIVGIFVFLLMYLPLYWFAGMKENERDLFLKPLEKLIR